MRYAMKGAAVIIGFLFVFWAIILLTTVYPAEAPKQEPPPTMEVLQLRLSNIEQALRIMELEYPALLKAKTELTAEIEKRKKEEKK